MLDERIVLDPGGVISTEVQEGEGDGGYFNDAKEEGGVVALAVGAKGANGGYGNGGYVMDHHEFGFVDEKEPDGDGPEVVSDLKEGELSQVVELGDATHEGRGGHGGKCGEGVNAVQTEKEVDHEVGPLIGDLVHVGLVGFATALGREMGLEQGHEKALDDANDDKDGGNDDERFVELALCHERGSVMKQGDGVLVLPKGCQGFRVQRCRYHEG